MEAGSARWCPAMGQEAVARKCHLNVLPSPAVPEQRPSLPGELCGLPAGVAPEPADTALRVLRDHPPQRMVAVRDLPRSVPLSRPIALGAAAAGEEPRAVKGHPAGNGRNKKPKPLRAAASRVRTCAGRPHWISSPTP